MIPFIIRTLSLFIPLKGMKGNKAKGLIKKINVGNKKFKFKEEIIKDVYDYDDIRYEIVWSHIKDNWFKEVAKW